MAERDRVIVAGGGPVGLVAAASLAAEGVPVTVLEAERDVPRDLRASTFHPPTLDMLDRFGAAEKCVAQGLVCPHWQFRDRKEGVIATFDLGLLADLTRHPYRLQCEQWRLSLILRDYLAEAPDAEIDFGARVVGCAQGADDVTATVERPDGSRETLAGRFLIAADGARSVIRKHTGVAFEGMTIPEIFLTLSTPYPFHEAFPDLANIAYLSDPDEWLVLLRTREFWRVLFPTDPEQTEEEMLAPEAIQARLAAVHDAGAPYELVHRTAYRVHERVAAKYVHGRIYLAGDAAHLNNPLGGMGMNGGVHDAVNLAEKLTTVWRGAPIETMGRYERQRRKVALETVQATALRNRQILNERDPAAREARHDELRRTVDDPEAHRAYVLRSSMIQSLAELDAVA